MSVVYVTTIRYARQEDFARREDGQWFVRYYDQKGRPGTWNKTELNFDEQLRQGDLRPTKFTVRLPKEKSGFAGTQIFMVPDSWQDGQAAQYACRKDGQWFRRFIYVKGQDGYWQKVKGPPANIVPTDERARLPSA